ncbi:GDP-mannose-dependent alpha-(1-6)-phosphatidylinositol monomannoside mannosyltransferase [Pseudovibrio sp. Ad13]|uniref:glycosyltransferase family 4 protein n=1 Tax=Pseudovibrio sp. Ad13 TaxID=989396 RepID=UPI0007AE5856|nr:glycosyltransferase family 4 protein [Pseudovibrio sp. Ad13]KZK83529.1 GDP-mannose-dependent alpha-(1-6)-phosphatidylinositol monomannoside mannosyltransferase [Pseudovibrio sp. Ad13]
MEVGRIAVVVKGYPRLSETFIAQEIYGLQERGVGQLIVALRHPYDPYVHDVHEKITSDVLYLTEYLKDDPPRVQKAMAWAKKQPAYAAARACFEKDLKHKKNAERFRRWGQACVMAHELPEDVIWIHTHYLHSPCSVARYAALLSGRRWSFSAHAKDIWTTERWEIETKLADAAWGVTCTKANLAYLRSLCKEPDKISLVYHGLDFCGFPEAPRPATLRDGTGADGVRIISVGRLVDKKGYDNLLRAFSKLPKDLNWHFTHIGGGELSCSLKDLGVQLGLNDRISWLGAQPRKLVLEEMENADIFALACRVSKSGDRDGLPNVMMEAQAMALPCVSTEVSALPEIIESNETGLLCPAEDISALSEALQLLITYPSERERIGTNAFESVHRRFSASPGLDFLEEKFSRSLEPC